MGRPRRGNQRSALVAHTAESDTNDDGEQSLASKVMTRAVPTRLGYQGTDHVRGSTRYLETESELGHQDEDVRESIQPARNLDKPCNIIGRPFEYVPKPGPNSRQRIQASSFENDFKKRAKLQECQSDRPAAKMIT